VTRYGKHFKMTEVGRARAATKAGTARTSSGMRAAQIIWSRRLQTHLLCAMSATNSPGVWT
jgi:hypothetical protein